MDLESHYIDVNIFEDATGETFALRIQKSHTVEYVCEALKCRHKEFRDRNTTLYFMEHRLSPKWTLDDIIEQFMLEPWRPLQLILFPEKRETQVIDNATLDEISKVGPSINSDSGVLLLKGSQRRSDFVTFKEAMELLGLERKELQQLVQEGELHTFSSRGQTFFKKQELHDFRKSLREMINKEEQEPTSDFGAVTTIPQVNLPQAGADDTPWQEALPNISLADALPTPEIHNPSSNHFADLCDELNHKPAERPTENEQPVTTPPPQPGLMPNSSKEQPQRSLDITQQVTDIFPRINSLSENTKTLRPASSYQATHSQGKSASQEAQHALAISKRKPTVTDAPTTKLPTAGMLAHQEATTVKVEPAPEAETLEKNTTRESLLAGCRLTLNYYWQMMPFHNYPLILKLSCQEAATTSLPGDITVRPIFPGCLVVPQCLRLEHKVPFREKIWVTPLHQGSSLTQAKLEIRHQEELFDAIELPLRVCKRTLAKVFFLLFLITPLYRPVMEYLKPCLQRYPQVLQYLPPGELSLEWYLAGFFLFMAWISFSLSSPKERTLEFDFLATDNADDAQTTAT